MCGIAGIAGMEDRELVKKMMATLSHRGPDGEGIYSDSGLCMGHKRLSIIDLSEAGKQPMSNEDGTVWISFNGEIYNFRELREELEGKGHSFSSKTDSEVIVHLYEEEGIDGIKKLNGMFAFAVYDSLSKRLVLARDRVGIKPLYYYHGGEKLVFSSEPKAILEYPGLEPGMDAGSAFEYLVYGTTMGSSTLFQGIKRLLPGHVLVFSGGDAKIERFSGFSSGGARESGGLRQVLEDSVRDQMFSDVPVGAFLSGGIDSSTIVALMKKVSDKVDTFSIGFGWKNDETGFAREVAEELGTNHHELLLEEEAVPGAIQEMVGFNDDLTWDSAILPVHLLAKEARKRVTVVLTGEGSDELFAGYERYYPFSFPFSLAPSRVKLGLYKRYITLFGEEEASGIAKPHGGENPLAGIQAKPDLESVLSFETHQLLPNQLLNKVDRATMAVSLEARVPFLDNRVIDASARIPAGKKMFGMNGKIPLKKAVSGLVPEKAIKRKKKGFGASPAMWMKNREVRSSIEEALSKPSLAKELNLERLPQYLGLSGKDNRAAYKLWALYLLEMWHRRFIGE